MPLDHWYTSPLLPLVVVVVPMAVYAVCLVLDLPRRLLFRVAIAPVEPRVFEYLYGGARRVAHSAAERLRAGAH